MKGIIKYKGKLYKRAKNKTDLKKGDLVQLAAKRGSDYFLYNGVYEVTSGPFKLGDGRMSGAMITIPKEVTGETYSRGIKLGYNIGHSEYFKLVENVRVPKPLEPIKEPPLEIVDTSEFDELDEEEGTGRYCCGKRMVERGVVYTCLKCGSWEYSSS